MRGILVQPRSDWTAAGGTVTRVSSGSADAIDRIAIDRACTPFDGGGPSCGG